jgi:hypothetical protein
VRKEAKAAKAAEKKRKRSEEKAAKKLEKERKVGLRGWLGWWWDVGRYPCAVCVSVQVSSHMPVGEQKL